jgi:hypothetical protein
MSPTLQLEPYTPSSSAGLTPRKVHWGCCLASCVQLIGLGF